MKKLESRTVDGRTVDRDDAPPKKASVVHFVYRSEHGMTRDYFPCDTNAQRGTHVQTTSWSKVTCKECLKWAPQQHRRDTSLDVFADALVDGRQAGDPHPRKQ